MPASSRLPWNGCTPQGYLDRRASLKEMQTHRLSLMSPTPPCLSNEPLSPTNAPNSTVWRPFFCTMMPVLSTCPHQILRVNSALPTEWLADAATG